MFSLKSIFSASILVCVGAVFTAQAAVDSFKQLDQTQQEQRKLLVGTWYGELDLADGGTRMQITRRAPDGTYKVTFRTRESSGQTWDQTEIGFWGVAGSVYFTITRGWMDGQQFAEADPTDASLNDAYEILELDDDTFSYRALQSGNEYQLNRVDDAFSFPDQASHDAIRNTPVGPAVFVLVAGR